MIRGSIRRAKGFGSTSFRLSDVKAEKRQKIHKYIADIFKRFVYHSIKKKVKYQATGAYWMPPSGTAVVEMIVFPKMDSAYEGSTSD